jgi:hypothetical protein
MFIHDIVDGKVGPPVQISGNFRLVDMCHDGSYMAADVNNQQYHRSPSQSQWQDYFTMALYFNGGIELYRNWQASCRQSSHYVGITARGQPVLYQNDRYTQLPGHALWVGMGWDGAVFHIADNFRVYLWDGGTWSELPVSGRDWQRDDMTQIWVGNAANDPTAAGNVQCSFAPPFTGASAWREQECLGVLGRYVFLLNPCTEGTCVLNPAGRFGTYMH